MAEYSLNVRFLPCAHTATEWASSTYKDKILKSGEIGYEKNTGRYKIGDGTNKWANLPWAKATPYGDFIPLNTSGGIGSIAGDGKYWYCLIATIKISSNYINRPITFEISGRGFLTSIVQVMFQSVDNTDPGLNSFTTNGYDKFYIVKSDTSTWKIYGTYTERYGSLVLHRITGSGSNIGVTVNLENVDALPAETTQASYYGNVSYATNAGSATQANKLTVNAGSSTNPVYFNGGVPTACSGRTVPGIKSASGVTTLGWGTNNDYVADISLLAYWNGAYSGTSSNLAYCKQGAFGTIVTKAAGDYLAVGGTAVAAKKLANYYSARQESANLTTDGSGGVINFKATGSMKTGKPMTDGHILHFYWDNNGGWDAQFFIPAGDENNYAPQWRGMNGGAWQDWRTILDSGNYTSYTVKKDGTGASGTWGISISGNAATATSATNATNAVSAATASILGRNTSYDYNITGVTWFDIDGKAGAVAQANDTPTTAWWHILRFNHSNSNGFYTDLAVPFNANSLYYKRIANGAVQNGWVTVLDALNYNDYAPKKDGTGASGTWGISITGNASTATSATKATQDSAGQQINTTYIKALSVSGQTITYTKGSGTTGTITTQDKNVYQSASTTSNFRPLLMGHTNTTSASSLGTAVTNQTYVNTAIYAQPSTGTIYATKFSGALVGNSDTTTKWKTARTITINGDFTGSVSLDGSANVSFNLWNYYGKVSVGNTNNYPYHRIAKLDTITSTYQDRASTLYISQDYNGAGFGIIRICLRTNNTGSASSVEAYWLVRKGLAEDSVKIGIYNVFGETYADVFFKTGGTYASTVVRDIASGTRGAVNRTWTLINSGESNGTTTTDKLASYECWVDIETAATELHSQAYSTIVTSSDAGDVYRSERAYNDESGNNIKASYAASLSVSGTTVTLKSKSGATLSTITTQDNDTKNTAGSTNSSSKLFLIGATSQATNPQTYSHDTAYVNTDGHLYSNSKQVVNLSDSQALTNKTYNGYTLGAACAKAVTNNTSVGSLGWSSSIGATNVPTMNTIAYWNGAYSGTSSNLAYCTKGAFGSIVTKNTGDYLSSSGGTLTGPLTISHQASATMSSDTNNPRIVFSENGEQPVILAYTDYDSYRSPAGLKVLGGSSASPAWFEVEGNLYASTVTASTFIGSLTGTASFTNNTWNSMGDDAFIGDCNQAGCIGIKGKNGATGIYFSPYSGSTAQKISINGSGTMTITGTVTSTGGVVSTTANGFRITQGNYGFFIRNDGGATYFLLTNSGDPYGSWNNLRPITINNSTGKVTINGNPMPSFSLSGNTLNITV